MTDASTTSAAALTLTLDWLMVLDAISFLRLVPARPHRGKMSVERSLLQHDVAHVMCRIFRTYLELASSRDQTPPIGNWSRFSPRTSRNIWVRRSFDTWK